MIPERTAPGQRIHPNRGGVRQTAHVQIEQTRDNVFTVTATSQELSALVAAARMALDAMRAAPEPPPSEALEILDRVLADFDRARSRLSGAQDG
jgi:hypothetical protein